MRWFVPPPPKHTSPEVCIAITDANIYNSIQFVVMYASIKQVPSDVIKAPVRSFVVSSWRNHVIADRRIKPCIVRSRRLDANDDAIGIGRAAVIGAANVAVPETVRHVLRRAVVD